MRCKKACLIVDLREGQNVAQIPNMMTVLAAAGWKVDIVLKVYDGETMRLAIKAAKKNYDLIISYGGDGTLNEVLNGVIHARAKSIVGVIPGGTANEWAGEIGLPGDHVKAALTLVNSDARDVDLGCVGVQGLIFPGVTPDISGPDKKASAKKTRQKDRAAKAKNHFLLMAGLGIDAAIIAHTSEPLKHRLGQVAFDLAAAKELPHQKPFTVDIQAVGSDDNTEHWQGEALQIIVANTRRYANMVQITPDAFLDDGVLDVCVITGGSPLTTMEQLSSLVLRRKPDPTTSKYFRGSNISIRVPASILMQLDGDTVDLKDYLSSADHASLQKARDSHEVLVNYRFTAEPHALPIAIPRTYDNTLFQHAFHSARTEQPEGTRPGDDLPIQDTQQQPVENVSSLLEQGYKVTVVGAVPNPEKEQTYIIAGNTRKQPKDETVPVAVLIDNDAVVLRSTGEHVVTASVEKLEEGAEIVVEGKKNKRGVIRATRVVA